MRFATAIALVALSATAASAEPRKLDMLDFFTGKSHAENVMTIVFKRPAKLIVDSVGGKGDRGDFVLIDTIREEGKPVRTRKWVMRPDGPNHFTGALSDSVSPVDVTVSGDQAMIRYTMKGGLHVEQRLQLQGDGKTLSNKVVVRKLGMKFARIEGTIRKLD